MFNLERRRRAGTSTVKPIRTEDERLARLLAMPIAELPGEDEDGHISCRTCNTLEKRHCLYVKDVYRLTYTDLITVKNFGDKAMAELRAALRKIDLPIPSRWRKPGAKKRKK